MNLNHYSDPPLLYRDGVGKRKPGVSRCYTIRAGLTERDSYGGLVSRLRGEFLCPSASYQPVVLPPILPSSLRPEQPRAQSVGDILDSFRRPSTFKHDFGPPGVRASKPTPPETRLATTASTADLRNFALRAFDSRIPTDAEIARVERYTTTREENKLSISRKPDSAKDGEGDAHIWLVDLETAMRSHLVRMEVCERHAMLEMMALEYINFVLKPEIDDLTEAERTSRGSILYEEEKAWNGLLYETPLACAINEGVRAHRARTIKMARLEARRRAREVQINGIMAIHHGDGIRTQPRANKEDSAGSPKAPVNDARRIVQLYLNAKPGQVDEKEGGCSGGDTRHPSCVDCSATPLGSFFGEGVNPSKALAYLRLPQFPEGPRGSSVITVPFINYSFRGNGRKVIGIAEFAPLIDESAVEYRAIVRAEQEERRDLIKMAREEAEGVVRWAHKRMHLERLFFWREQRDLTLKEDLKNAVEEVVDKLRAKNIDPAVETQLRRCGNAEKISRSEIVEEEKASRGLLRSERDKLYQSYYATELVKAHSKFLEEIYKESLLGLSDLIVENERIDRMWIHLCYSEWIRLVVEPHLKMLKCLYAVSIDPSKYRALVILQRAVRRSLRGQLHWRFSNREIGREIRKQRDAKRIALGRESMNAYRAKLNRERMLIEKEVANHYARLQSALLLEEHNLRAALLTQERVSFALIAWEFHEFIRKVVQRGT